MNEMILVVTDGTSAYITLEFDFDPNEEELLGKFFDWDEADEFCEEQNSIIQD